MTEGRTSYSATNSSNEDSITLVLFNRAWMLGLYGSRIAALTFTILPCGPRIGMNTRHIYFTAGKRTLSVTSYNYLQRPAEMTSSSAFAFSAL
jgi:hypothetical protein